MKIEREEKKKGIMEKGEEFFLPYDITTHRTVGTKKLCEIMKSPLEESIVFCHIICACLFVNFQKRVRGQNQFKK